MKALTIWQPWASLKACGAKKFETRSWETRYRGPIAIHAGKESYGPYACELPIGFTDAAVNAMWPGTTDPCVITDNWDELPRGAIIATGELVACHRIVCHGGRGISSQGPGWLETESGIYEPTDQELLFGDWTPGRYAWEIVNMRMLPWPIPAKGAQGLWNWDERA